MGDTSPRGSLAADPQEAVVIRRNRRLFIVWGIVVLALATAFASLTLRALYVRSVTSSEFSQYVLDQKLGHAEIADDASGFQGDFCVLHLNQPIPSAQLADKTMNLMKQYHTLDGGSSLTVEYNQRGKNVVEADAVFHPNDDSVTMTLYDGTQKQVVQKKVEWAGASQGGDGS